jgi:hypothetical protein
MCENTRVRRQNVGALSKLNIGERLYIGADYCGQVQDAHHEQSLIHEHTDDVRVPLRTSDFPLQPLRLTTSAKGQDTTYYFRLRSVEAFPGFLVLQRVLRMLHCSFQRDVVPPGSVESVGFRRKWRCGDYSSLSPQWDLTTS